MGLGSEGRSPHFRQAGPLAGKPQHGKSISKIYVSIALGVTENAHRNTDGDDLALGHREYKRVYHNGTMSATTTPKHLTRTLV